MDSNATSLQAGGGAGGGWLHALTLTHTQLSTSGQYRCTACTVQYSTLQYRYSTVQYRKVQYSTVQPVHYWCCRCQITEASAPFHTEQQDRNLSVISK